MESYDEAPNMFVTIKNKLNTQAKSPIVTDEPPPHHSFEERIQNSDHKKEKQQEMKKALDLQIQWKLKHDRRVDGSRTKWHSSSFLGDHEDERIAARKSKA